MTTITEIARTLSEEFAKTVRQAEENEVDALNDVCLELAKIQEKFITQTNALLKSFDNQLSDLYANIAIIRNNKRLPEETKQRKGTADAVQAVPPPG
jgi:hypothetical protein